MYSERKDYYAERYKKYKGAIAADQLAYKEANPEVVKANKARYRNANKDKIAIQAKLYKAKTRYRVNSNAAKLRFVKKTGSPMPVESEAIKVYYKIAVALSKAHGIKYEVDHIIPIIHDEVTGLHTACNLQVITQFNNRSKGNSL